MDYLETTVDLNKVDSLIAGDCQHVLFDLLNFRVRPKLHGEVEILAEVLMPDFYIGVYVSCQRNISCLIVLQKLC